MFGCFFQIRLTAEVGIYVELKMSMANHSKRNPTFNLLESRAFAASAVLANHSLLWVTGGYSSLSEGPLDTTEFVDVTNSVVREGPKLPQPLQWHCLVQLNHNQVMLIGGMNDMEKSLILRENYLCCLMIVQANVRRLAKSYMMKRP